MRIVIAGVLALVACERPVSRPPVQRTPLVRLAPGYRPGGLAIADDGRRWAYRVQKPDAFTLYAAGMAPVPLRAAFPPRFGPRGRLLYSWIFEPGSLHPTLRIGDRMVATGFARQGQLRFSPDGARWAVSGALGPATPPPGPESPLAMLVDGDVMGQYSDLSLPAFSPDGRHVAWLAEEGPAALALVVDGVVQRRFMTDATSPAATPRRPRGGLQPGLQTQCVVQYLSDGRLLWLSLWEGAWVVGRGDEVLASYAANLGAEVEGSPTQPQAVATAPAVLPSSFAIAADSPVAVWWERRAGPEPRWRVVRNGQPVDGIECADAWPQPPVVSADGERVAYPCRVAAAGEPAGRLAVDVIVAGQRYGPYADIWGLSLAPSGEGAAWAAQRPGAADVWELFATGRVLGPIMTRPLGTVVDRAGRVGWAGWQGDRIAVGVDAFTIARADELAFGPQETGATAREATLTWVLRRGARVVRFDTPVRDGITGQ